MEIGIIGEAQSGKSTLFQIMTGVNSRALHGEQYVNGVAKVPDERLYKLSAIFKPKKTIPAAVTYIDVNVSGEKAWNTIRQNLSTVDGLLHIVNCFVTPALDDAVKRYTALQQELILSDLIVVENRLERLAKTHGKGEKPEDAIHRLVLPKAKEMLESGKPLRDLKLSVEEQNSIKGFTFWTARPELVVLNVAEGERDISEEFAKKLSLSEPVVSICCKLEEEITELAKEEQAEFMSSLGIKVPAFERIIKTSFNMAHKMVFFTVGDDEVRAWDVPINSPAPRAASAIHKYFERGFIKAEVVSYKDFMEHGATIAQVKGAGKYRLEGKEYIVQDGDIINFRFNV